MTAPDELTSTEDDGDDALVRALCRVSAERDALAEQVARVQARSSELLEEARAARRALAAAVDPALPLAGADDEGRRQGLLAELRSVVGELGAGEVLALVATARRFVALRGRW